MRKDKGDLSNKGKKPLKEKQLDYKMKEDKGKGFSSKKHKRQEKLYKLQKIHLLQFNMCIIIINVVMGA
jgi:hypothetical protein